MGGPHYREEFEILQNIEATPKASGHSSRQVPKTCGNRVYYLRSFDCCILGCDCSSIRVEYHQDCQKRMVQDWPFHSSGQRQFPLVASPVAAAIDAIHDTCEYSMTMVGSLPCREKFPASRLSHFSTLRAARRKARN